jgi:hypothetical protein
MEVITRAEAERGTTSDYEDEQGLARKTTFFSGEEGSDRPSAFRIDFSPTPSGRIMPHFHKVAQFQVILEGDAYLGKKQAPAISVHFADPSTPYGPIVPADPATGFSYLTLRPAVRGAVYWMPGNKQEMDGRAGRNVTATMPKVSLPRDGVATEDLVEHWEDGLAMRAVRMGPGTSTTLSASDSSGGEYALVTRGDVTVSERVLETASLVFLAPGEAVELYANEDGAELLLMQFPQRILPRESTKSDAEALPA